MVKKADIPRHIVDCALELAAERGWRRTRLGDIARAAKLSMAELHRHYPSRAAILDAYFRRVDIEMLEGVEPELKAEPARDRLFDVIMRRFDVMNRHKEGVRAIVLDLACDPCAAPWSWCRLRRSLLWILAAADLDRGGLRGLVRLKGLALIYVTTLRVWLDDDSEDMAKTMAALDRRLGRVDDLLSTLRDRGRRPPEPAEEAPESA